MTKPDDTAAQSAKPRRGRPALGPGPSPADLRRLYVKRGLSIRDTAQALGVTKDAVLRGLRAAGIAPRPNTRTSRLAVYGPAALRQRVAAGGLRATARELGVAWATLRDFLKRHE